MIIYLDSLVALNNYHIPNVIKKYLKYINYFLLYSLISESAFIKLIILLNIGTQKMSQKIKNVLDHNKMYKK